MAVKNSDYWEERLANIVWNSYNTLEEENIALLDHYDKAMNSIRSELMRLEELKELTRSKKYRLEHLKSLQDQILKECEKLGESVEKDMIGNVSKQMQDVHGTAFTNISNEKFSKLSKNACKDIINTPWHGSSFSQRLWKNTGKLANELNDILSVGITKGKTIAEMAFQLSSRMNKDMNICHRLVRTETINSLNRASIRGLIDAGIKYVRWWAAEDERTCKTCGTNHGEVYPIDKAPNLPCHPGCRCTWLPVFEDELDSISLEKNVKIFDDDLKTPIREGYLNKDVAKIKSTLIEALKSKNVKKVSLAGMDVNLAVDNVTQLSNLIRKYNLSIGSVTTKEFTGADRNVGASAVAKNLREIKLKNLKNESDNIDLLYGCDKININRELFGDSPDCFNKRINRLIGIKSIPNIEQENYSVFVLTHEVGHCLHYHLNGTVNNPMKLNQELYSYFEKIKTDGSIDNISKYCRDDYYEMVADAFAEVELSSNPSKESQKIIKILMKYMKGE